MSPRSVASIVTPTFNSERFLDATMASVIGQVPGDEIGFDLHYHIQDGGSFDGTQDIVRRWQEKLTQHHGPNRITLTFASQRDTGMYDAINRGFAATPLADSQLMGWINPDDILTPQAISSALNILRDVPDVQWLTNPVTLIDVNGVVIMRFDPGTFSRNALAGGLHTGRYRKSFVQQEGTFWRPHLWQAVGGLDASYRLAGDWDLWRRFASLASLTVVEATFGLHRRHECQLSNDLRKYLAEVDHSIRTRGIKPTTDLPEHVQRVKLDGDVWRQTAWVPPPPKRYNWGRQLLSKGNRARLQLTRRLFDRQYRVV